MHVSIPKAVSKIGSVLASKWGRLAVGILLLLLLYKARGLYIQTTSANVRSFHSVMTLFVLYSITFSLISYTCLTFFDISVASRSNNKRAVLISTSLGFSTLVMANLGVILMAAKHHGLIEFDTNKPDSWLIYFLGAFGAMFWASSTRSLSNDDRKRERIKSLQNELWKNPDNLHLKAFLVNETIAQGLHMDLEFRDCIREMIKYLASETDRRQEFRFYTHLIKEMEKSQPPVS